MIRFNKPYITGKELNYIQDAIERGRLSGNQQYTHWCHSLFQERYGFAKTLLTTSCTDALEMCALLLNIEPGDQVIMPSYTFVSTANAFILRGAHIVFADSRTDNPNLDHEQIEQLVTDKTKAIVVVHYAGIACDMDAILDITERNGLYVVEDAAQAIDSYYKDRPLGSIGHLAAFSFHETKNVISGEGGMLVVNDRDFARRADIIWEKGTNRSEFFRGEIAKYGWVDIGSSFLPSDMIAAVLYAQLENLDDIQQRRKEIWRYYFEELMELEKLGFVSLPSLPNYATNNAHMFYMVCREDVDRDALIDYLHRHDIKAVFHYLSLHKSSYYADKHDGRELPMSDFYSEKLIRLPMFYELEDDELSLITRKVKQFFFSTYNRG